MIILKKFKKINFLENFLKILNKIIYFFGIFVFIILVIFFLYYNQSGFKYSNPPKVLLSKINDKVIVRYLGLDLRNIDEYLKIFTLNFFSNFQSSKLDKVFIEINQKSILGLEMQRKLRKENKGEIPQNLRHTYPARIKNQEQIYKIKIRTKGVRNLHWYDKDMTSYKIDLRGEDRIWGLEEFSVQKPITRNYTYEYLFHELLGYVGLIKIKYFFINLFINDQDLGVYAVEESFSKELIERQKFRNGPIFGISEELGEYYPNIRYELYSENYWIGQYPEMTSKLFSILNDIKNGDKHVNNHFDLDKWARYFAIIDLTGAYHGSLVKSVKGYYNPTTALFEPIGYDLHKGAGDFNDFILLDFLQEDKPNCIYLCDHKDWYFKFFLDENNNLNYSFLNLYIKYLKKFSEKGFLEKFMNIHNDQLKEYNKEIYKDNSKTDKITRRGAGYFIFDDQYLLSRSKLLKKKISSTNIDGVTISKIGDNLRYEDYGDTKFPLKAQILDCDTNTVKEFFLAGKIDIKIDPSCKKIRIADHVGNLRIIDLNENILISTRKNIDFKEKFKKLKDNPQITKINDNKFIINNNLLINENTILNKNNYFILKQNQNINIINNATLFVEGKIDFKNNQDFPTKIFSQDGTGSVIFNKNNFEFENIIFDGLSSPKLNHYILYGGVNFINSEISLNNIIVKNSKDEDAMNIINSKSKINNIVFENIFSDALDIDFGESFFKNINCKKIYNDCLDVSGALINGDKFVAINSNDKGISVGENSEVYINNVSVKNNKIALAIKDGSTAKFDNIIFENNTYDIALFNKKKEFELPTLFLNDVKNLDNKKILQSEKTHLEINKNVLRGNLSDAEINSLIYKQ